MNDTIRVMLVDEHTMVRRGLSVFLKVKPDLELVGEANDGAEAIDLCETLQPDVVLMDLMMPVMDGATATRHIKTRWPHIQVIALTSFQETALIQEVLQAGAIGYLLKTVSADELARAIRAAKAGQSTLAPEAMQALIQAPPADETAPNAERIEQYELTPRELEVLQLLAEGLSNPDIADRLFVSRATAKAHVSHILDKLGVSNRAEAVALALREEIVQ